MHHGINMGMQFPGKGQNRSSDNMHMPSMNMDSNSYLPQGSLEQQFSSSSDGTQSDHGMTTVFPVPPGSILVPQSNGSFILMQLMPNNTYIPFAAPVVVDTQAGFQNAGNHPFQQMNSLDSNAKMQQHLQAPSQFNSSIVLNGSHNTQSNTQNIRKPGAVDPLKPDSGPMDRKKTINPSRPNTSTKPDLCESDENIQSRSAYTSSSFWGVSRCGRDRKWQSQIRYESKIKYLGRFTTQVEAALVYDEHARSLKGSKTPTNFIPLNPEMRSHLVEETSRNRGMLPVEFHKYLSVSVFGGDDSDNLSEADELNQDELKDPDIKSSITDIHS